MFQRRCNSFLMDVVSQLCFAGNTSPSATLIDKLFGYITLRSKDGKTLFTKDMNMLETDIDPSPVCRSFLLQQIIRSRRYAFFKDKTNKHM